jgi:LPXTG-site transpeptidase (sortase) family protein
VRPPADPSTERISRGNALASEDGSDGREPQPLTRKRSKADVAVRTFGEVMITLGMVVVLYVGYEVYVTSWISAGKQRTAAAALDDTWRSQRGTHIDLIDGKGFAKVHIPVFGPDWSKTVLEGTSDAVLEAGPGHYKGSALPGEVGNFAVAGHRVGKDSPFNDLNLLSSCDAIVVETQQDWYVYRVLPKTANELKSWDSTKAKTPRCADINQPAGPYSGLLGQEIITPDQTDVVAPVPHHADLQLTKQQQPMSLITLTTCHPRFDNSQRLIVHGALVKHYVKDLAHPGNNLPPELKES